MRGGSSPQKGGQAAQALGRSRGGFSTKIHVSVDGLGNPLRFILTGGQQHDITQAEELIAGYAGEHEFCRWRGLVSSMVCLLLMFPLLSTVNLSGLALTILNSQECGATFNFTCTDLSFPCAPAVSVTRLEWTPGKGVGLRVNGHL